MILDPSAVGFTRVKKMAVLAVLKGNGKICLYRTAEYPSVIGGNAAWNVNGNNETALLSGKINILKSEFNKLNS